MFKNILPMEDTHPSLINDGVPVAAQTMAVNKVFWVFCTPNICVTCWLFGILASQNLDFKSALISIVLGNICGAIPASIIAWMGPVTRLSQIEATKFSFGRYGVRIPAVLNWFTAIGWDALNNVPSASALAALGVMYGLATPFWAALAVLAMTQMIVAIYGHHVVQSISKYFGYFLLTIFTAIGIKTMVNLPVIIPVSSHGFSWHAFLLSFSIVFLNPAGYMSFAADYTRYLPANTPRPAIFWRVFGGLITSMILLESFGLISSVAITDPTADGIIAMLRQTSGSFAPLVLLSIGLSAIPANALNDNSAAYCLVTAGVKLFRPLSAAIGAVIGFMLAMYGAGHILSLVQNILLLLFYWMMAWAGIAIVQYFYLPRLQNRAVTNWMPGATIFSIVTVASIALFVVNDFYTGPVAHWLGGIDIGSYLAFTVSALAYWYAVRKSPGF